VLPTKKVANHWLLETKQQVNAFYWISTSGRGRLHLVVPSLKRITQIYLLLVFKIQRLKFKSLNKFIEHFFKVCHHVVKHPRVYIAQVPFLKNFKRGGVFFQRGDSNGRFSACQYGQIQKSYRKFPLLAF